MSHQNEIAVIGGTGTVGRRIVTALQAAGTDVRVLSRRSTPYSVDLTTGAGLDAALRGCRVVVDAGNGSPRHPRPVLVDGTSRVLHAAREVGIDHLVTVSIVGIDQVPTRYYRAKLDQERLVQAGPVPWSIVRSTQFHELVAGLLGVLGRWRVTPRSSVLLQPIAAEEAARAIAEVALGPARETTVTVAGPEARALSRLARDWSERRRRRLLAVPLPVVGPTRRPLLAGALTCADPDWTGATPFAAWLADHR